MTEEESNAEGWELSPIGSMQPVCPDCGCLVGWEETTKHARSHQFTPEEAFKLGVEVGRRTTREFGVDMPDNV